MGVPVVQQMTRVLFSHGFSRPAWSIRRRITLFPQQRLRTSRPQHRLTRPLYIHRISCRRQMHHARCIRRRKCVAFAHKQRGKQSTVASQVKNSQADGAPRSLLNNACKQLLHTQEQGSGTPLRKETTLRNNRDNDSSFAMPCKVLAYPIRTVTHAYTPPDTPAKRGKLLTTVAGRDLPAQQLQHSGHRESFVHCNSAIMDSVGQFNSSLSKRAGHQAGHYWQRKLLHRTPTTHVYSSNQTVKLGSQAEKQATPQMELQTGRTSSCANYHPDSTTFKNATVTKTAIKQASAFNETSTEPVICIRAASKQGSPIIKTVIKSGSTGTQPMVSLKHAIK